MHIIEDSGIATVLLGRKKVIQCLPVISNLTLSCTMVIATNASLENIYIKMLNVVHVFPSHLGPFVCSSKAIGIMSISHLPFEMELSLFFLAQAESKTHQTGAITRCICKSIIHLCWLIDLHHTANFIGNLSILLIKK